MIKASSEQARLFEGVGESAGRKGSHKTEPSLNCAFCTIAKGGEPTRHLVFEDTTSLAFLDRRPVFLGHCLMIPRVHYETLYDLPKDLVGQLFANLQLIGAAVQEAMRAEGTFIGINNKISQSVPHLHIHIIPRQSGDGLRGFFWPRRKYQSQEQMNEIAESIRNVITKSPSKTEE